MSLRDLIRGFLASDPDPESFYSSTPFRFAQSIGAGASPVTGLLPLNLGTALRVGDGIWLEEIWAQMTFGAAATIEAVGLQLTDNLPLLLKALAPPIFTTLSPGGANAFVTATFPIAEANRLITFSDLSSYAGQTGGANAALQPWNIRLQVGFSAGTMSLTWGVKVRLVRGLQEG